MTERELEQMLAQAIDHAAPDDLEGVFSRCQPQSDNVIALNPEAANSAPQEPAAANTVEEPAAISQAPAKKRAWWKGLIAAVLALALVGAGAAGGVWYQNNLAVASVVSLDVNPSIELKVNQNEKVLTCDPLNDEAREVLAEMAGGRDLEGAKLDVAVNAIVGALLRHGYLEDISSAILISVEDNNADRGARLQRQLTATVDGVLQNASSQASVLSQNMTVDAGLDSQAQQNSISAGKAALVNRVIALNPALPFDKLAALSVEELRDLIEIGAPALPIGKEAARIAAETYAGTLSVDCVTVEVDPELDDPTPHYEVELGGHHSSDTFDCIVDAFTGDILRTTGLPSAAGGHHDTQSPAPQTTTPATADPAPAVSAAPQTTPAPQSTPAPQTTPAPQSTPAPQTTTAPAVTDIGVDAAKSAALNHAGLSGSQVTWVKAERDYDDGRLEYELEFIYNNTEYEYTVLASNGSVIKYETEPVRGGGTQSNPAPQNTPAPATQPPVQAPTPPTQAPAAQAPADIGAEAATAAALAHAGLSAGQVTGLKCERDWEDDHHSGGHHGRLEYEIEFKCNGYEYEYTIDGATGAILDHECDWDD